jgi:Cu2+-containing amine oxidase
MPSSPAAPNLHPLAPVTGDEIIAAREIVFASGRAEVPNEALRFAYIGLCDPPKEMVRNVDAASASSSCRAPKLMWPR